MIYSLCHPGTGEIRYIGQSRTPRRRLRAHLSLARSGNDAPVYRWIRKLITNGLAPTIIILQDSFADYGINEAEVSWIAEARARGLRLLNVTAGGEESPMSHPEIALKVAATNRKSGKLRRPRPDDVRARISAGQQARWERWRQHATQVERAALTARCAIAAKSLWDGMSQIEKAARLKHQVEASVKSVKGSQRTDEQRRAHSETMRSRWNDPVIRAAYLRGFSKRSSERQPVSGLV